MEVVLRKYAFTNLLWLGMLSYPREVLAYLYGEKKNGFVDVKAVLCNLRGRRSLDECDILNDDVLRRIEKNLDRTEGRIVGDVHTHPEQVRHYKLVEFNMFRDYMDEIFNSTNPSRGDKKDMKKNGEVYLIMSLFSMEILRDTALLDFNQDTNLSRIFKTRDFLFCLSAWHHSRSKKDFVKAPIKIEGLDSLC